MLSLLLGYLFQHGASWLAMYVLMAVLSLMMIVCASGRIPVDTAIGKRHSMKKNEQQRWVMSVWVLCFALFAFLLAEPIFTMWLPSDEEPFGMAADSAAFYITTTGREIHRLFVNQFTVRFVNWDLPADLHVCRAGLSGDCRQQREYDIILICAGLFGFCNSGLFSAS